MGPFENTENQDNFEGDIFEIVENYNMSQDYIRIESLEASSIENWGISENTDYCWDILSFVD